MYSKFKLDIDQNADFYIKNYYACGKEYSEEHKRNLKNGLENYIDYNTGLINGDKLEKEWFNEIKADIFISHSHKDKDLAISIAGWLKEEMKLKAFVDCTVWGYADDILKEINNKYNYLRTEDDGSITYSHRKANYAASHVYLMLNSALNNMINKTECFMFINTNNSTRTMDKDRATTETLSPWIYSEIVMANTMKPQPPVRPTYLEKNAVFYGEMNEDMGMTHKVDFSDFETVDLSTFTIWKNEIKYDEHPLDTLYKLAKKRDVLYG